jgi:tetratricopeptide (TPR) repeat protein
MQAAEESYTRAIAAAQALFRSNRPDAASRLALARAEIGKADVMWPRGRVDPAVALYRDAVSQGDAVLSADAGNKDALKSNFRAWDHMMAAHENRGDVAAALDDATHCLKFAEAMENRDLQAYVREREGRFEVLEGKAGDGVRDVTSAVDTYEALGYTSASLGKRRSLAKAYKSLGDAQRANGDPGAAERSYHRSISDAGRLVREDAKSVPLQTDLGQAYAALIDLLVASGKKADAHEQTAAALLLLRPIAEEPSATSWQMYYCAWLLENTTFPDLRDDAAALRLAQRMIKKDPADPDVLDVLARATARMGDAAGAATLEHKALAGNPAPDVRARIEAELSALGGGATPERQPR